MLRPYRRLESKQGTLASSTSSFQKHVESNDNDEESVVRRKTFVVKSLLGSYSYRDLFSFVLVFILMLFTICYVKNTINRVLVSSTPESLSSFIKNGFMQEVSYYDIKEVDDNSFYSTQPLGLRYCNKSVPEVAKKHNFIKIEGRRISVIVYAGSSRHSHPGFRNFITSLSTTGFKHIHIIEPPATTREINNYTHANYTGEANFWKERLQHFYEKTMEFASDEIILFCDAYDTIFTQSPSVLLNRFRLFQSDIVFSTEILCDTISCRRDLKLKDFFVSISPKSNLYKYINAGVFMGTAVALRKFMLCAISYAKDGRDDQTAFSHCFHNFYLQNNNAKMNTLNTDLALSVKLDYESLLFGNIPPVSDLFDQTWDFQTSRADAFYEIFEIPFLYRKHSLRSQLTDFPLYYSPVAIHFPGIAYRPGLHEQFFNPCQQFLKWRYNEIGRTLFSSGRIPNMAYGFISKANKQNSLLRLDYKANTEKYFSSPVKGLNIGSPYTIFDVNEVKSRSHQEEWIKTFHNNIRTYSDAVLSEINVESTKNSENEPQALANRHHVSSSFSSSHEINNERRKSNILKLLEKKMELFEQQTPVKRRHLSLIDNAATSVPSGFLKSLFKQETTIAPVAQVVLIETIVVMGKMPEMTDQISLYLSDNIIDIVDKNVFWWPNKIYFRIQFSSLYMPVLTESELLTMENDIVLGIRKLVKSVKHIRVLCSMHQHLDSKLLDLFKYESSNTVFVLVEKVVTIREHSRKGKQAESQNIVEVLDENLLSLPLPQRYLDALLKPFFKSPYYAYGFSGFFVEKEESAKSHWRLRSTSHLVYDALIPVDVLNLHGGLVFRRSMLKIFHSDDVLVDLMNTQQCQCKSESLMISAFLSKNKISRVNLPYDGTFDVKRHNVTHSMNLSASNDIMGDFDSCIECLSADFENGWLGNLNFSTSIFGPENVKTDTKIIIPNCETSRFEEIPHVNNLPGFSFQYNWDSASATSPCTQHLMTRYEETAGILGVGQFMAENQTMFSPVVESKKPFLIKLEVGARLCLYKVSWHGDSVRSLKLKYCMLPPASYDDSKVNSHYAAIESGELCFYKGTMPNFGGTRQESRHQELAWCTEPGEMNIKFYSEYRPARYKDMEGDKLFSSSNHSIETFDRKLRSKHVGDIVKNNFKKRSHGIVMHKVQARCIERVIKPIRYPNVYLHVNVKGIFGLFVSTTYEPHDNVSPAERIASLRPARCFKKFDNLP